MSYRVGVYQKHVSRVVNVRVLLLILSLGVSMLTTAVSAGQFTARSQEFSSACRWQGRLIHEIQGRGMESPFEGLDIEIAGVVSAVLPDLKGFTLQTPADFEDDDQQTSEGIFIWTGRQSAQKTMPVVGESLKVVGTVSEFHGMTQLKAHHFESLCSQRFEINSVMPASPLDDLEPYEGMHFKIAKAQVSAVAELHAYGVFAVAPVLSGQASTSTLRIDDGSNKAAPYEPYAQFNLKPKMAMQLQDMSGVLFYSFNHFRLHLTALGHATQKSLDQQNKQKKQKGQAMPFTVPSDRGDVRILSLNTQNYLNGRVSSGRVRYLQTRGPRDQGEYNAKKRRLTQVIQAIDADIIVLQEVENDIHQSRPAIEDLLQEIGAGYKLLRFSSKADVGFGDDQITQFLAFKASNSLESIGPLRSFSASAHGNGRPLLLQEFRLVKNQQVASFHLATSHLKSKRNSCGDDIGCRHKRQKQAQRLEHALSKVQTASNIPVLWVGDFNAQPHEPTMQYLASRHWQALLPEDSYSYSYRGQPMLLDHGLWRLPKKSSKKSSLQPSAQIWNLTSSRSIQVSDHDAIVVDLNL